MADSLEQLAASHAAQRLTRKQRNADLRANGIDPDGPDGAEYRRLFAAACATPKLAIYVWQEAGRVDVRVQPDDEAPPHPDAVKLKTRLGTRAEAEEFASGVMKMAQDMGVDSIKLLKHL